MGAASLIAATAFGCATPVGEHQLAIDDRDNTILLVGHEVADYDDWYPVFIDVGEPLRIEHNATGHRLFRSHDNSDFVNVAVEFPTADDLFGFVQDPALLDEMDQAGVILDTVSVIISEEVEAIKYDDDGYDDDYDFDDRETTAILLVSHEVADYDEWYPVFTDVGGALRVEHNVTQHRLFRSLDNPDLVAVHVEFPTLDDLFNFAQDPALIDEMDQAGVLLDTVNVTISQEVEWPYYPEKYDD